jgi:hypothetical protein
MVGSIKSVHGGPLKMCLKIETRLFCYLRDLRS